MYDIEQNALYHGAYGVGKQDSPAECNTSSGESDLFSRQTEKGSNI